MKSFRESPHAQLQKARARVDIQPRGFDFIRGRVLGFYPGGVALHSPGSRSAPWGIAARIVILPRRGCTMWGGWLCNPSGVGQMGCYRSPRVRFATLGCGVQPLRGKKGGSSRMLPVTIPETRNFKTRAAGLCGSASFQTAYGITAAGHAATDPAADRSLDQVVRAQAEADDHGEIDDQDPGLNEVSGIREVRSGE